MSPVQPSQQLVDSSNAKLRNRSPLRFFSLVFVLSLPFWLAGTLTGLQLLPGLPIAALMFVCPVTAALILVYGENKTSGVIALLERSFDYKQVRPKIWYAPVLLLMPGVMVLSYELMRLMGVPLPTPQVAFLATTAMLIAFFIAALGEELGWSGYITDPMQNRWGGAPSRSYPGAGMGRLAHNSTRTSAQIAFVDRLVVSRHGSNAGCDGLALQQHKQERLRCSSLSHHDQRHLATVSDPRFVLRAACHRFDYDFCGRHSDGRAGP